MRYPTRLNALVALRLMIITRREYRLLDPLRFVAPDHYPLALRHSRHLLTGAPHGRVGWGAAAAVGFSIAGRLSDIFGRRYVILVGQALTVVGGIVACTAKTMNQLIAGEVILGMSIGTISVAYAGRSIWRWARLQLADGCQDCRRFFLTR